MNTYIYEGPVMEFNRCIEHNWKASTSAVNEARARSNLAYKYKINTCRTAAARITLPGKLKEVPANG